MICTVEWKKLNLFRNYIVYLSLLTLINAFLNNLKLVPLET